MDLVLNNLQKLICIKANHQPTNQPTKVDGLAMILLSIN